MVQHSNNVDAWMVIQPMSGGKYYQCPEDAERQADRLNRGLTRYPGQRDVRRYPYAVRQVRVRADDPHLISSKQSAAEHDRLLSSMGRTEPQRPSLPPPGLDAHNSQGMPGRCGQISNRLHCRSRRRYADQVSSTVKGR